MLVLTAMAATLSAGALIAAVLVLIPLPSHCRARNVAILSLIAWLFVVDLIYGVNTIVWAGNVEVRIVVWCDISMCCIYASLEWVSDHCYPSYQNRYRGIGSAACGSDVHLQTSRTGIVRASGMPHLRR